MTEQEDHLVHDITRLAQAKTHVRWLLDHTDGLVDMHGLTYWAGEVERLRKAIKETL
jgi:hypothetical protein